MAKKHFDKVILLDSSSVIRVTTYQEGTTWSEVGIAGDFCHQLWLSKSQAGKLGAALLNAVEFLNRAEKSPES